MEHQALLIYGQIAVSGEGLKQAFYIQTFKDPIGPVPAKSKILLSGKGVKNDEAKKSFQDLFDILKDRSISITIHENSELLEIKKRGPFRFQIVLPVEEYKKRIKISHMGYEEYREFRETLSKDDRTKRMRKINDAVASCVDDKLAALNLIQANRFETLTSSDESKTSGNKPKTPEEFYFEAVKDYRSPEDTEKNRSPLPQKDGSKGKAPEDTEKDRSPGPLFRIPKGFFAKDKEITDAYHLDTLIHNDDLRQKITDELRLVHCLLFFDIYYEVYKTIRSRIEKYITISTAQIIEAIVVRIAETFGKAASIGGLPKESLTIGSIAYCANPKHITELLADEEEIASASAKLVTRSDLFQRADGTNNLDEWLKILEDLPIENDKKRNLCNDARSEIERIENSKTGKKESKKRTTIKESINKVEFTVRVRSSSKSNEWQTEECNFEALAKKLQVTRLNQFYKDVFPNDDEGAKKVGKNFVKFPNETRNYIHILKKLPTNESKDWQKEMKDSLTLLRELIPLLVTYVENQQAEH